MDNEISGSPSLNNELFEEMRALMEEEFADVLASYREETPKFLEEIRLALKNGDISSLTAAAHQIKSTSLALGVVKLSDYARALEAIGRSGSVENAQAYLDFATLEFKQVASHLY